MVGVWDFIFRGWFGAELGVRVWKGFIRAVAWGVVLNGLVFRELTQCKISSTKLQPTDEGIEDAKRAATDKKPAKARPTYAKPSKKCKKGKKDKKCKKGKKRG